MQKDGEKMKISKDDILCGICGGCYPDDCICGSKAWDVELKVVRGVVKELIEVIDPKGDIVREWQHAGVICDLIKEKFEGVLKDD
jgi:hypothetical protein